MGEQSLVYIISIYSPAILAKIVISLYAVTHRPQMILFSISADSSIQSTIM